MKSLLPLLPLLVLAGCRSKAPGYTPTPPKAVPKLTVDVKSAAELMPLEVGNRWNYSLRLDRDQNGKSLGSADQSVAYRVESRAADGAAVLLLEQDGQLMDRQEWKATAQGLYQTNAGFGKTPYTPPQPVALLPLKTDQSFRWSGRGVMADGKVAHGDSVSKILEPQNVDTGMGAMSAIPVVTNTTWPTGKSVNTAWFVPQVGLVRYRQEWVNQSGIRDVLVLTLSSYARKGS